MNKNKWESLTPEWLTSRRVVGAVTLATGLWAILYQMSTIGNIGVGEIIKTIVFHPFEFVELLLKPPGLWIWLVILVSAASKVQMIIDAKRFQLNYLAVAAWMLLAFTGDFRGFSTTQEAFDPISSPFVTIPYTNIEALFLLFPLWAVVDVVDSIFESSKREQIQRELKGEKS